MKAGAEAKGVTARQKDAMMTEPAREGLSMPLTILVFLGSARDSSPPRPARLGLRVARQCVEHLTVQGHRASLIDPLDYDLSGPFKPQFAYGPVKAPPALDQLAAAIAGADAYVMVSPEYNHSMSPALSHLLNHFGSSLFSYRPSAIVSYSAGQWGGVRAAVGMRTFLSELGCLPVSAMIHVPKAAEVLDEDGTFTPEVDAEQWAGYFARTFDQLQWWANAARAQTAISEPSSRPPAFTQAPFQRNAP